MPTLSLQRSHGLPRNPRVGVTGPDPSRRTSDGRSIARSQRQSRHGRSVSPSDIDESIVLADAGWGAAPGCRFAAAATHSRHPSSITGGDPGERRDRVARQPAGLQCDLGRLTDEMASRDHFRVDVLAHVATGQHTVAGLVEIERLLHLDEAGAAHGCPNGR